MANDERLAYVALALTPGFSTERLEALHHSIGSWNGALAAPFARLCAVPGFSPAAATAIRRVDRGAARRAVREAGWLGGQVLLPEDEHFPAILRLMDDPPALLFALGDLALLERPAVAVVGSRSPTPYGEKVCRDLAGIAAAAGLVVVSGMARGLDAVGQLAALDAGGGTIGVLGNGLGVIYPAANRALYERVAREGLLLTEFPPGERPRIWTFPRRNRLISALARVTVVVEAAVNSGALGTADFAGDQGRDVMAVPGPITSPTSAGTNRLIRDGAGPLLEAADLLAHYPEAKPVPQVALGAPSAAVRATPVDSLAPEERRVFEAVDAVPRAVDDLVGTVGLPPSQLLSLLCALELAGVVEQEEGMRFRRAGA